MYMSRMTAALAVCALAALPALAQEDPNVPTGLGQALGMPGYAAQIDSGYTVASGERPTPEPNTFGTLSYTELNIPTEGFSPLNDGQWAHFANGFSQKAGGVNTATCAPVHLPSGAALDGITTWTSDTDATANITYTLFVFDLVTNTSTTPFNFATSGAPGLERFFRNMTPDLTIDNDRKSYALCIFHDAVGGTLQNAGATFWYKLQVSPAPATASFADVPTSHPFFRFVEALASSGITGGCGGGNYCPDTAVTRGQMAVFLSTALGLHFGDF